MSRHKKFLIILITVITIFLMGCVSNAILLGAPGNPVSTALAEFSAQLYKITHYPNSDYVISAVRYDEKDERYYVGFSSAERADSDFSLGYNPIGLLVFNSYERRVTKRANTACRLSDEYNAAVEENLTAAPYPAKFLRIGRLSWQCADGPYDSAHYIISDELELGGRYDLAELGAKAGYIWIKVVVDSPEKVTIEKLAETLLHVRKTLDQAGLPFYRIDCILTNSGGTYNEFLHLIDFLYQDIFVEDLESRLTEALNS